MSALSILLTALAEQPPDVRADFVGHLVCNVANNPNVSTMPPALRADFERFVTTVGFLATDTDEQTRARIDAHFAKHALDPELMRLFLALDQEIAQRSSDNASDAAQKASALLGGASSLRPVGAGERPKGAMGGGLAGLLAARTQKPTTR